MNLSKTVEALEKKGYTVSVFARAEEAAEYLNDQIDKTTVGFGGSVTLQELELYDSLAEHNEVHWHWRPEEGKKPIQIRDLAAETEVYLTSANGISETGEIVNIDGTGNRIAATLCGHKKVYFVVGKNKIAPDLQQTIYRVRNVAAPRNAMRLKMETPCAVKGDRCYDCDSPQRICSAMTVHFQKMASCEMEVVIIEDELGF